MGGLEMFGQDTILHLFLPTLAHGQGLRYLMKSSSGNIPEFCFPVSIPGMAYRFCPLVMHLESVSLPIDLERCPLDDLLSFAFWSLPRKVSQVILHPLTSPA